MTNGKRVELLAVFAKTLAERLNDDERAKFLEAARPAIALAIVNQAELSERPATIRDAWNRYSEEGKC